jgi:hypothetical protein
MFLFKKQLAGGCWMDKNIILYFKLKCLFFCNCDDSIPKISSETKFVSLVFALRVKLKYAIFQKNMGRS